MKSLKEYLEESVQSGGPKGMRGKSQEMDLAAQSPIYKKLKYKGWLIDPSIHAASQAFQRRPDMELEDWLKLHKKMMTWIISNKKEKSGEYLFYSGMMRQGYVVAVDYRRKKVRIITVLPKGRNNPKPGTDKIVVEGREINLIEIIELD